jgi:hypothetical protein
LPSGGRVRERLAHGFATARAVDDRLVGASTADIFKTLLRLVLNKY